MKFWRRLNAALAAPPKSHARTTSYWIGYECWVVAAVPVAPAPVGPVQPAAVA